MAKKRKGILIEYAVMEATADLYGEGEVGPTSFVWESGAGLVDVVWWDEALDPIAAIAEAISKHGPFVPGAPEDWSVMPEEAGRLDCDFLGDREYFPADEASIAAWKKGKKKLYAVRVHVLIKFIEASLPTGTQIARRLKVQAV